MNNTRALVYTVLLGVVAALTQWLLWLEGLPERADTFVGPSRSDYVVREFQLAAYDEEGRFSFGATGPRAIRHPFLGSIEIDQPSLRFADSDGHPWRSTSAHGWVDKAGTVAKLSGEVRMTRAAAPGVLPVVVATERLSVNTRTRLAESDVAVEMSQPGSILRGVGLRAELGTRRVELMQQVTAHYDPKLRPKKPS